MRILLSVSTIYDIGGISTSVLNFANEVSKIHNLTIVVSSGYISPNIVLPENIRIIKGPSRIGDCFVSRELLLGQPLLRRLLRNCRRCVRRIVGLQRIIDWSFRHFRVEGQYDAAIAFRNNQYFASGRLSTGGDYDLVQKCVDAKRKVAWMHNDLRKEGYTTEICRKVFRNFDAVVNVCDDNKVTFDSVIPEYKDKSYVVFNMYNLNTILKKSNEYKAFEDDGKIHITTVARLWNRQKKLDRIVEACHRLVKDDICNFKWKIVGEGEDRNSLQNKITEYNLNEYLSLEGLKSNPYPYMAQADVFVLTSEYEGLPMTVKEAQILECPTFVTNFGSAKEAVLDGKEGVICENSEEGVFLMIRNMLLLPEKLEEYRKYLQEHPVNNDVALEQLSIACNLK